MKTKMHKDIRAAGVVASVSMIALGVILVWRGTDTTRWLVREVENR